MTPGYDEWRLRGPAEHVCVGIQVGDSCGRYFEPDEDAPRGYKPKPCDGEMVDDGADIFCDMCGSQSEG